MSKVPYIGLRPFRSDEIDIFFGREDLIGKLLDKLKEKHFLAIAGLSGCGKSSLVNAGLLPELERGFMAHAGVNWHIATMKPNNQPFTNLANSLNVQLFKGEESIHEIKMEIENSEMGLRRILDKSEFSETENFLLVIDQFEELFRFETLNDKEKSREFINFFLDSTKTKLENLYIIITIRSEFLGECSWFQGLAEKINEGLFITPRLTRLQLEEAIEKPAKVFGGEIETTLLKQLLDDSEQNSDRLPLMQHILSSMWYHVKNNSNYESKDSVIKLELSLYKKFGGLDRSLSIHINSIYENSSEDKKTIIEVLFRSLVEVDETLPRMRRPVKLKDVVELVQSKLGNNLYLVADAYDKVIEIVDEFRKNGRKFLRPTTDDKLELDNDDILDITHESLIRQWDRLGEWQKEEAESAEKYKFLETNALLWADGKAPFLGTPALELALEWREREQPTKIWAKRYGKDGGKYFEQTMDFLKESEKAEYEKRNKASKALEEKINLLRENRDKERTNKELAEKNLEKERENKKLAEQNLVLSEEKRKKEIKEKESAQQKSLLLQAKLGAEQKISLLSQQKLKLAKLVIVITLTGVIVTSLGLSIIFDKSQELEKEKQVLEEITDKLQISQSELQEKNTNLEISEANLREKSQNLAKEKVDHASNLFNYHLIHSKLLTEQDNFKESKRILSKNQELFNDVPISQHHAHKLLERFIDIASDTSENIYDAKVPLYVLDVKENLLVAGGEIATLILLNTNNHKIKKLEGHSDDINAVAFSPNNDWLVSGGDDKKIILWSSDGEKLDKVETDSRITTLATHPKYSFFVSGDESGNIILWEIFSSKLNKKYTFKIDSPLQLQMKPHKEQISDSGLAFNRDGSLLVSTSYDGKVNLWGILIHEYLLRQTLPIKLDYSLKSSIKPIKHHSKIYSVKFSPDDNTLLITDENDEIYLWDIQSIKSLYDPQLYIDGFIFKDKLIKIKGHKDKVFSANFSNDGRYIISGSADADLRLWDTESNITLKVMQGHEDYVTDIAIQNDTVYSVSKDGTIKRWSIDLPHQKIINFGKTAISSAISPTGEYIAVGFEDGTLRLYSLSDQKLLFEEQGHTDRIRNLTFNKEGNLLASVSYDKTLKLWQIENDELQLIETSNEQEDELYSVAFSHDSSNLAVASYGERISLFHTEDIKKSYYSFHEQAISVAFHETNPQLLMGGKNEIFISNLSNLKNPETFQFIQQKQKNGLIFRAVFSPDGKKIASVGQDSIIYIYDTKSKELLQKLKGHKNTIYDVVFSPDNQQIATVSSDATVKMWDLEKEGNLLFTLQLPTNSFEEGDELSPVYDFDFRCSEQKPKTCWIAVPLTRGKLVLYNFGEIYE